MARSAPILGMSLGLGDGLHKRGRETDGGRKGDHVFGVACLEDSDAVC